MCYISCSIFSLKQFYIWILLRFVIVCRYVHWTMVLCYVYIHYFILNIAPPNMISLYRAVSCRTEACSGGLEYNATLGLVREVSSCVQNDNN